MRVRRLLAFALPFVSAALLAGACSSVPDLTFVDVDGGVDGGTGVDATRVDGSSSSGSGGVDAAVDQAAGPVYCADGKTAPPNGICCGSVPCVGCERRDCDSCDATCKIRNAACCKRGQGAIKCGAVDSCR